MSTLNFKGIVNLKRDYRL